jgi:hypothetical protein
MSTETKHTPGPWSYNISPLKSYHRVPEISICNADGQEFIRQSYDTYSDQAMLLEGDACLIAAAPDMLEVLEELDECASYWSQYDVPIGIHDRIKRAIAKAKGVRP